MQLQPNKKYSRKDVIATVICLCALSTSRAACIEPNNLSLDIGPMWQENLVKTMGSTSPRPINHKNQEKILSFGK